MGVHVFEGIMYHVCVTVTCGVQGGSYRSAGYHGQMQVDHMAPTQVQL